LENLRGIIFLNFFLFVEIRIVFFTQITNHFQPFFLEIRCSFPRGLLFFSRGIVVLFPGDCCSFPGGLLFFSRGIVVLFPGDCCSFLKFLTFSFKLFFLFPNIHSTFFLLSVEVVRSFPSSLIPVPGCFRFFFKKPLFAGVFALKWHTESHSKAFKRERG